MNIKIPEPVQKVISALEGAGFEAYVVGGCVRDAMLGLNPYDFDITTSAQPDEIKNVCRSFKTVDTGIRHGTVTVICDSLSIEVTTYRTERGYTDSRHPDEVDFVTDISEDLSRRDFTVNAMAYNKKTGLVDIFGGLEDLKNNTLKCVGAPIKRFNEDALRIMRALRFSADYGFVIEDETSKAILSEKCDLAQISKERITAELNRLILGEYAEDVLIKYKSVMTEIVTPWELSRWSRNVSLCCLLPKDTAMRLAALLIDVDAPESVMKSLKYNNKTIKSVSQLLKTARLNNLNNLSDVKRIIGQVGAEFALNCLLFMSTQAKIDGEKEPEQKYLSLIKEAEKIVLGGECVSLKTLEVNGDDLIAMGFPEGKRIGEILNIVLDAVINGKIENEKGKIYDFILLTLKDE